MLQPSFEIIQTLLAPDNGYGRCDAKCQMLASKSSFMCLWFHLAHICLQVDATPPSSDPRHQDLCLPHRPITFPYNKVIIHNSRKKKGFSFYLDTFDIIIFLSTLSNFITLLNEN